MGEGDGSGHASIDPNAGQLTVIYFRLWKTEKNQGVTQQGNAKEGR